MKIDILGVKIDSLTQQQALEKIESFFAPKAHPPLAGNSDSQHHLITANPEIVLKAWFDEKYRDLIKQASLIVADGIGLLWAAKFLSLKSSHLLTSLIQVLVSGISLIINPRSCQEILPERITGVDLVEKICELASKNGWKVYLLGGERGVAEKTADVLKKRYLNLNIVGYDSGPFFQPPCLPSASPPPALLRKAKWAGLANSGQANNSQSSNPKFQNLVNNINKKQPDILFVAFGAPKQDYFINDNLSKMTSVKVAMGVGGAFDFISGKAKRAPEVYRDLGLEWLYRLIHEPWRAVRIFNATVRFIYNVVKYKHLIK